MKKFKTIWHYGIQFFNTETELEDATYKVGIDYYSGLIKNMTYDEAYKVAEIHPNCLKYYESAMMPLFKKKGKKSKSTECPIMAIESLKSNNEKDYRYILIWKII